MSEAGFVEGEPFNVGSFMAQAVGEDLSMRSAREAFRAAGGRMSNQSFASMYSEVRDAIGGREAIQAIDYSSIPDAGLYGSWASGGEGNYSTFVTSYVRRVGERGLEPRYYTYTTSEPHTPQEAIDAAGSWITDNPDQAAAYGEGVYAGGVVTSMVRSR